MDTDRIKQIRKGKEKAAQRKYDNFQASGDNKYYYEYQHYSDLVSICDIMLKHGVYDEPEDMKAFLGDVLLFGRKHGICREE